MRPNAARQHQEFVGAAYTNNASGASLTTLYVVDSNLDIVATLGSPDGTPDCSPNTGQLFTIGPLGFNTSDLAGFDISGLSGTAYAALTTSRGKFFAALYRQSRDWCGNTDQRSEVVLQSAA